MSLLKFFVFPVKISGFVFEILTSHVFFFVVSLCHYLTPSLLSSLQEEELALC